MAWLVNAYKINSYDNFFDEKIAKNSLTVAPNTFVKLASGFIDIASASDNIYGVATTDKTFSSTNQTVAVDTVKYRPIDALDQYTLPVLGETITFVGDLITDNVVNLKVNGVAMTPVAFNSSNSQTLTDLAAQLVTDFPTVIAAAAAGTRMIKIEPITNNTNVVVTNIVVTAWSSQTTWTVANNVLTAANVGSYADIQSATNQGLDYFTVNATASGLALKIEGILWGGSVAIVSIANA